MKNVISTIALSLACALGLHAANPQLAALYINDSDGSVINSFSPSTTEYAVDLSRPATVSLSASPLDASTLVSFDVNGKALGNHSTVRLDKTSNIIRVLLANGSDTSTYTVTVNVAPAFSGDARELSIYQIMTASFMRQETGEPGFTDLWGPAGHRTDGNLKGVTKSLDYIKELGMNAIWMTPIFDTREGLGGEKLQATGYFATDYFNIDPRFGTKEDLRELCDEAHARGIHIILDFVGGHTGGFVQPSPQGNVMEIVPEKVSCIRPNQGEWGDIAYPGSLDFMKECVRYWIDEFGVDGYRLDQCYQVYQGGHNYWKDLREEVEAVCAERKARGEKWGILGYMVGEDWAGPESITSTKLDGLRSVFDFAGRGNAVWLTKADYVHYIYSSPENRGYDKGVLPNLFISNHDMDRVADIITDESELMLRYAVLANYSGPVTFYYGDEWGDVSGNGNPDNKGRTSGHLTANNAREQRLHDAVQALFNARSTNPAMWRGTSAYRSSGNLIEVTKTDADTGNKVLFIFNIGDPTSWSLPAGVSGTDVVSGKPLSGTISIDYCKPVVIVAD